MGALPMEDPDLREHLLNITRYAIDDYSMTIHASMKVKIYREINQVYSDLIPFSFHVDLLCHQGNAGLTIFSLTTLDE